MDRNGVNDRETYDEIVERAKEMNEKLKREAAENLELIKRYSMALAELCNEDGKYISNYAWFRRQNNDHRLWWIHSQELAVKQNKNHTGIAGAVVARAIAIRLRG